MISTIRPGRTKALIQRKRRKAHIASIGAGEQQWLTACTRTVVVQDTPFALFPDAVEQIEDADLCIRCSELYATADEFYDRGYAAGLAAATRAVAAKVH